MTTTLALVAMFVIVLGSVVALSWQAIIRNRRRTRILKWLDGAVRDSSGGDKS